MSLSFRILPLSVKSLSYLISHSSLRYRILNNSLRYRLWISLWVIEYHTVPWDIEYWITLKRYRLLNSSLSYRILSNSLRYRICHFTVMSLRYRSQLWLVDFLRYRIVTLTYRMTWDLELLTSLIVQTTSRTMYLGKSSIFNLQPCLFFQPCFPSLRHDIQIFFQALLCDMICIFTHLKLVPITSTKYKWKSN